MVQAWEDELPSYLSAVMREERSGKVYTASSHMGIARHALSALDPVMQIENGNEYSRLLDGAK